jgi:hypothetical protein
MKQTLLATLCGALVTCAALAPAHALAGNGPGLEINIGGIGPAVDAKAYAKVRLLLADALFNNTTSYFAVSGYGKEGGFSACVEKGMFATDASFARLTRSLKAVRVDRSTSFYNVDEVARCTYPVAPTPAPEPLAQQ